VIKSLSSRSVAALCALLVSGAAASAQTVPSSWTADVGAVGATGFATGSSGNFAVHGAGADVWGTSDAFRIVYAKLSGDGYVVAQVASVENVNAWTKAGVMMRESLAANSRHAFMLVSPEKGLAFQRRTVTGGTSTSTPGGSGAGPSFVKLTRSGSTFTAFRSADGVTWTKVGSDTIPMASTIYAGIAVTSHVKGVLATANFASTIVAGGASDTSSDTSSGSTDSSSASTTETSTAPAPAPSPSTTLETLRVLHWNVHHGGIGTDGKYDPNRIATWIAAMSPDIASLNEVDTQAQVSAIVTALQAKTGVTWNAVFSGKGNLVLSRLTLNASSRCRYDPSYEAWAPHASTIVNGRSLNIWSSHLHVSSASARLAETKALQACAGNWSEARILAGDYNMQYGSTEYKASVVDYTDAWLAAKALGTATNYSGNCDGCTRNSRIDYVFTSKGASFLRLQAAQVVDTRNSAGVMPSDHKPLLVTYAVN
jgi:endonuclease/exonuclease/phosphatase family metal-dependent hydrolase